MRFASSIAKGTIWLWYSDAVNFLPPGDICHRKVGQNRLIKLIDLLEYKKRQERRSKDALQELADEAQELNLGY